MIPILVKHVFGVVALLFGVILIGWFIYNQISPADEFQANFRSIIQLVIPIACLFVGWRWLRYEGKGIEEVTPPDLNCPELVAATAKAKKTLPVFLAEVEKGIDGAFIKFPLNTPNGGIEHIWAYVHFFRDGRFNVSLANEPFSKDAGTEGRRNVSIEDVEDWQIMRPDGTIKGGYSLIALFEFRQRSGKPVSPKMKKQKATLIDAN